MMQKPKIIFLDAVGTLFGVKGSVGQAYSDIAQKFGIYVSAKTLNQAFLQSFQAAPPPVFPDMEPDEIASCEFHWWKSVAQQTFQKVGVLHQFADFSAFFAQLYQYFATADPWYVYPDVFPALERWQQREIELGIISNFDSRLYLVLAELGLESFFSSITISTEAGAAKPDKEIFMTALAKYQCNPELAWHIGDSWTEDYQGATAAGLRAFIVDRKE